MIHVKRCTSPEVGHYLDAVAELRIAVFREFPYLYDGSLEYERSYLKTWENTERAVLVLAFDGDKVVGASTGMPLEDEEEVFQAPFRAAALDPAGFFYCAESVLLPAWRGQGLGLRFFAEREAHARELGGFHSVAFCAVCRPEDHPLRPPGYEPLNRFWEKRGFTRHPELRAHFSWKDIDQEEQTSKPLEFWLKSLQYNT